MDEEEKKQLLNEMKRIFQDGYNDLQREIERLKKEFAPDGEQPWYHELVLSSVEVGIIFRALQKYKAFLEYFYKDVKPGSPAYIEFDSEIEHTKEVIGFVQAVLYGKAELICKRLT